MYTFLNLDEIAGWNRFELEAVCRAQAQTSYLGDHTSLCRILARYKLFVDTRDVGFGSHVLLDGFWEMWLTQFMAGYVKPGMVVADVGANFGYYSVLLADLVGPTGHAFAVEPNPHAATMLRRALSVNGFAGHSTVIEAALGNADSGTLRLFVPDGEPKNACLVDPQFNAGDAGRVHPVPCRSLDAIVSDHDRLDFIKIDAEGAEEQILDGMANSLATHKPAIVLEFNAARYADAAGFLERIMSHYPVLEYISFKGKAAKITPEEVLTQNFGEDWLLFLRP